MSKTFQHVAILVLALLAANGVWQLASADVKLAVVRPQWEFAVHRIEKAEKIDPAEGWELVAVDQGLLYFKRPK